MKTINAEYTAPPCILYVENHNDSREMLTLMLTGVGYAMSTATSIADGLISARRKHFDLYILDSKLADGNGIELCLQIRAFDALTPIIFYSSLAYPWNIKAGLDAGAQAYLTKPMGIYTITQTIAGLLGEAKISRVQIAPRESSDKNDRTHNLSGIDFSA